VLNKEIRYGGTITYSGAEEKAYCEAFAAYLGGGFADAVNSGTNAMYIALRALDLPPGSEVIVPPTTDVGGTMPVVMNLCVPIPADAAPGSFLTSADEISKVISPRTSAIVVTHVFGYPLDMDPIVALGREHGLPVVEDCAQAHGSIYHGRKVGTFGSVAAFSTMFGKHHCTGGQGGVVFSTDPYLFGKAKRIGDRGKAFGLPGVAGNVVASLNFNQDELSMAIGRVQLEKLSGSVRARRAFAALVDAGLRGIDGVSLLGDPPDALNSYLSMMLRLDLSRFRCDSSGFAAALSAEGIDGIYPGYTVFPTDMPWHENAAVFGSSGLPWSLVSADNAPRSFPLPNARESNKCMIRVDIHEGLGAREARDLIAAVRKVARHFSVA
jgi:dTDP-4-amino-4,6-dideoxygalactose transaminase